MTDERPVPGDIFQENLSASKVKGFAQCPLKHWYQYLSDETRTKPSAGYRELGSAVHESIEEVLQENREMRDASILSHRFKQLYRYKDPDVPENLYDRGLNVLDTAAKFIENNRSASIREIELRHEFQVGGRIDHGYTAIMDIVTDNGIWDWKTGSCTDSDGETRDYIIRDEIIQGMVYASAYLNKYGEYPEYVKFVYLNEPGVRTLDPTKDKYDKMLAYSSSLLNAWETGEFPAKTGSHCGFCDYEYVCEAQEVSMANVSYHLY